MGSLSIGPIVLLQPWWLLACIALAILALRWTSNVQPNDWQRVMSPAVFHFLGARTGTHKGANWLLWTAALTALCLTQPVMRQSNDDTWRHSIGWVVVVDVSRSMSLDDTVPSRLHAARLALKDLSDASGARSIALIFFAGDAFLIVPPAFDKSVFNEHAALVEHGVIETEGSNLARALSLSASVVADSGFVTSRVFVLGDTGGINARSVSAAAYLAENGHQVDVLVFGSTTDQGSQTAVDFRVAEDLATAGGGNVIYGNAFGALDYKQLALDDQSSASTHADLKSLVWKSQSHWLLLIALPLLLMQFRHEHQQ